MKPPPRPVENEEGPVMPPRSGGLRKQGAVVVEEEVDLHGLTRDEALSRLEQFFAGSVRRGLRTVLVITGKGVNSPAGPVLKGAVEAWLQGRGRAMIAGFSEAPRDKGGSGAFVVVLKRTGRR